MKARLIVTCTKYEIAWVRGAAKLRGLSLQEYVKQAINAQLRREGVDAVLFRERGDD